MPATCSYEWRRAQEHRRHRGTGGDSQDPHASGFASTLAGAAAGSLPGGLIFKTRTALCCVADDPARPTLKCSGRSEAIGDDVGLK